MIIIMIDNYGQKHKIWKNEKDEEDDDLDDE